MYKFTRLLTVLGSVLVLVLVSTPSWAVDSQQVTEMIAKADSYRLN
ncbi:outer membrane lipoprotein-sorting protein, partial [Vibrio sp. 10N.261.45.F1]